MFRVATEYGYNMGCEELNELMNIMFVEKDVNPLGYIISVCMWNGEAKICWFILQQWDQYLWHQFLYLYEDIIRNMKWQFQRKHFLRLQRIMTADMRHWSYRNNFNILENQFMYIYCLMIPNWIISYLPTTIFLISCSKVSFLF